MSDEKKHPEQVDIRLTLSISSVVNFFKRQLGYKTKDDKSTRNVADDPKRQA